MAMVAASQAVSFPSLPFFRTLNIADFGAFSLPQSPKSHLSIRCSATSRFGSPKSGVVGSERFKDGAIPGTYWSENAELGEEVSIFFNKGFETVTAIAKVGENLLRVAERCGVMIPNPDFCFEGSCCHCEMEVSGGAKEVGYRAGSGVDELIRSCICPVPESSNSIHVNLINEEDVWGEQVV